MDSLSIFQKMIGVPFEREPRRGVGAVVRGAAPGSSSSSVVADSPERRSSQSTGRRNVERPRGISWAGQVPLRPKNSPPLHPRSHCEQQLADARGAMAMATEGFVF